MNSLPKMTNTQQTIQEQVAEAEQLQEEVHLTELQPVQQSQIQETNVDSDSNATDALKALRSFSQTNEFTYREYNFYYEFDEMKMLNENFRDLSDNKKVSVRKDSKSEEDILSDRKIKRGARNAPSDTQRVKKHRGQEIKRFRDNRSTEDCRLDNVTGTDSSHLSEETTVDVSHSDTGRDTVMPESDKVAKTDETVEPRAARKAIEDSRKEINAIIQANYLLEQENNNVIQEDENGGVSDLAKNLSDNSNNILVEEVTAKKYNCVICNAKFKGSGGLRNHHKVAHATGPLYKCDECGKEFPLKERLKLHVRTHTGFKPYKCSECDKSFARGGQLVQHRRTHSQVKPYHCSLCPGTFTCAANLGLHMKRHNGQKDHKCEICGRGFIRRDALKKHMECLHHDVKSFLCVICNKTLKGHLPQHMRTHAQDRPHGCATCGQRFAQKSQLTVHQRTHSGQRPFRCLVCWQAFAHSTALKLHTRRHTGERPFKCTECNAGFTQLPHWKKHMKCIHGRNEPYSCTICNSFFRIKSELESHQKFCKLSLNKSADDNDQVEIYSDQIKYRVMPIEKMRLLMAVLLKRISKPEKLDELGFGKRLIDEVLQDSLINAGKKPVKVGEVSEYDCLKKNVEKFLEWTVPENHWIQFKKMKKSVEEILEKLTTT